MKLTWLFVVLVELFKDGQAGFDGAFRSHVTEAALSHELRTRHYLGRRASPRLCHLLGQFSMEFRFRHRGLE